MVASLVDVPDHIKSPDSIELKVSGVDDSRIGVFCVWPIAKGTEFGPYDGKIIYRNDVDPRYSWDVYDLESLEYLHTIDATDPADGNWMRYVGCARFFEEQNIVSTQKEDQVYYRAFKEILPGKELLTWFQPKRKHRRQTGRADQGALQSAGDDQDASEVSAPGSPSSGKHKRKRKPKIIPDSYEGPLDFDLRRSVKPRGRGDDEFEPLQPGQKRRRRKKVESDNRSSSSLLEPPTPDYESSDASVFHASLASEPCSPGLEEDSVDSSKMSVSTSIVTKKREYTTATISEINETVDWTYPDRGQEFVFELKDYHIVTKHKKNKKLYKCDICLGFYKHMFSLKRHYLRNHINYKYLSKADMVNCLINLSQVKINMAARQQAAEKSPEEDCQDLESEVKYEESINERSKISESDVTQINGEVDDNLVAAAKEQSNEAVKKLVKICGNEDFCQNNNVLKLDRPNNGSISEEKNEENKELQDNKTKLEVESGSLVANKDSKVKDDTSVTGVTGRLGNPVVNNHIGDSTSAEPDETFDEELDHLMCHETLNSSNEDIEDTSGVIKINLQGNASEIVKETVADDDAAVAEEKESRESGLYQCYTCYEVFDRVEDIREHVQNHPESSDSNCFACDKCNMMFKFKQNLVRHKKVHDEEADGLLSSDLTSKLTRAPVEKLAPGRKKTKDTVTDFITHDLDNLQVQTYRCDKCKNTYPSLSVLMKHVQSDHKSGSKFQCQYCGKDFLSLPNMKKHVRFHLGYRASCRYCSESFPNVGALRRHTRLVHPEHHKTKLLDKVFPNTAQTKSNQSVTGSACSSNKEVNEKVKTATTEIKTENKPYKEGYLYAHGVSFTADEIDDGGSRFKFSCTVCKKRFSNYVNMCRHRRKVHNDKPRELLSLDVSRKGANNSPIVIEDPVEVAQFYANVSHNIAVNLNAYIDGKFEVLNKYSDYIQIEDYTGLAKAKEELESVETKINSVEDHSEGENSVDLCWEDYNFPPYFKPARVVAIDKESVTPTEDTTSDTVIKKEVDKETTCVQEAVVSDSRETKSDSVDISEDANKMGKSSASLGMPSDKGAGQKSSSKSSVTNGRMFHKLRIFDGRMSGIQSPVLKGFEQVLMGEYANFENDLLPSDVDSPIKQRSQSVSSSRSNAARDSMSPEGTSSSDEVDYNRMARSELDALYADIDSPIMQALCPVHTPKSLSQLCEKVLGLNCYRPTDSGDDSPQSEDSSLLAKLLLTANKKAGYITAPHNSDPSLPDFSDEQDDSPFYNYESIAFGRNGQIERVCAICKSSFQDVDSLAHHHWKKHPSSMFSFLEVEQGNEIENLHYSQPSTKGALAVSDPGLHVIDEMDAFRCTLCGNFFKSVNKLHVHIINCSLIDPVYGVFKSEKSPGKSFMKKQFHKKFHNLFQGDIKTFRSKHSSSGEATKSQNRVFTGCRKRTSMILPDSPTKSYLELLRQTQEASTGYNPHNHVRRRELTQLVDTLTCEGCGLKFKTIILLERHVKNCTKKEKFKNVKPMTCPIMDESLAKIKNVCFYCEKSFTYTKSLVNHFQDFCLVKKSRHDRGELTEEEKQREKEIIEKVNKQQEDEKSPKDVDIDGCGKPKRHWQMGRRPKRKGNSWTSIKKRKVPLVRKSSDNDLSATLESNAEDDEMESEENYSDEDNSSDGFKQKPEDDLDIKPMEETDKVLVKAKPSEPSRSNMFVFPMKNGQINQTSVAIKQEPGIETVKEINNCDAELLSEKVKMEKKDEEIGSSDNPNIQENSCDEDTAAQLVSDIADVKSSEPSSKRTVKISIIPKERTESKDLHNTSLGCMSRYKVNVITMPKQEKGSKIDLAVSSTVFQCIAKQTDDDKEEDIVSEIPSKKVDNSLMVEGKRKRARVSKVEEFIRNTFRRKRNRKVQGHSNGSERQVNGQVPDTQGESGQVNEVQEVVKKRRGRPPKEEKVQSIATVSRKPGHHSRAQSQEHTSSLKDDSDSIDLQKDKVPRKPGRPAKVKAEEKKLEVEIRPESKEAGMTDFHETLNDSVCGIIADSQDIANARKSPSGTNLHPQAESSNRAELNVCESKDTVDHKDALLDGLEKIDADNVLSTNDFHKINPDNRLNDISNIVSCDEVDGDPSEKKSVSATKSSLAEVQRNVIAEDMTNANDSKNEDSNTKSWSSNSVNAEADDKLTDKNTVENDTNDLQNDELLSELTLQMETETKAVEVGSETKEQPNIALSEAEAKFNDQTEDPAVTVVNDEFKYSKDVDIDISDNSFMVEEVDAIKSPESSHRQDVGMVMSPGERVKMNKRSCKKEVDISSPIWVKRTSKTKTKLESSRKIAHGDTLLKEDDSIPTKECGNSVTKEGESVPEKVHSSKETENEKVKTCAGKSAVQKVKSNSGKAEKNEVIQNKSRTGSERVENVNKEKRSYKDGKTGLNKLRKVFDKTNNLSGLTNASASLKRKLLQDDNCASEAKIRRK